HPDGARDPGGQRPVLNLHYSVFNTQPRQRPAQTQGSPLMRFAAWRWWGERPRVAANRDHRPMVGQWSDALHVVWLIDRAGFGLYTWPGDHATGKGEEKSNVT